MVEQRREWQVSPVIPALRDLKSLPGALAGSQSTIFLLSGNLSNIGETVAYARGRGKQVFVHFDLIEGLGKDVHGLRWLAENVKPTGIITTRAPLINQARAFGLAVVQRMFVLDSQSLHTGLQLAKDAKPHFLEVMPGIAPEIIEQVVRLVSCPVIAGGLCRTEAHFRAAIQAGAVAVSTSEKALWQMPAGAGQA